MNPSPCTMGLRALNILFILDHLTSQAASRSLSSGHAKSRARGLWCFKVCDGPLRDSVSSRGGWEDDHGDGLVLRGERLSRVVQAT
ncbi:hypothetical protein BD779DRAFT_755128 [Infundibulicybe gibba]|nr:hypothetical protein BD779DRAFT_755128 [Infundibulicybe gibba]